MPPIMENKYFIMHNSRYDDRYDIYLYTKDQFLSLLEKNNWKVNMTDLLYRGIPTDIKSMYPKDTYNDHEVSYYVQGFTTKSAALNELTRPYNPILLNDRKLPNVRDFKIYLHNETGCMSDIFNENNINKEECQKNLLSDIENEIKSIEEFLNVKRDFWDNKPYCELDRTILLKGYEQEDERGY